MGINNLVVANGGANCLKLNVTEKVGKKITMPHINGNRKAKDYPHGQTGTKSTFRSHYKTIRAK